jgi:carbamoyl-phosphate synthase small subunit
MQKDCALVLSDGQIYYGEGFGALAPLPEELVPGRVLRKTAGEVVFNTGMTGYHEILTDPSYTAQLVVMTYPHLGNYGTDDDWSEVGPEAGAQRSKIKAAGFISRSYYKGPVPDDRLPLSEFMKRYDTPGISGIDTRKLTLSLRDDGQQNGVIVRLEEGQAELSTGALKKVQAFLNQMQSMEGLDLTPEVGTEETVVINPEGHPHFALVDCGVKMNIVRELTKIGCKVSVIPDTDPVDKIEHYPCDAFLFSSGPGDPGVLGDTVAMVKRLIGKMPVFGICLGNQLIGQALGGKTYKMKFGHHGVNHPVRDEITKKVFVTSQNHGFAVDESTLPPEVKIWFKNANDGTVEGLYHETLPVKCAQFHPESAPGPHDSSWIFQSFVDDTLAKLGEEQ